jgi:hypothetical protein
MNNKTHRFCILFNIFFVNLLLASCERRQIDLDDFKYHVTEFTELDTLQSEDIIESYHYIQLETTSASLLGEIKGLKIVDDQMFIRHQDAITVFNMDGKFLFTIDAIGRGPGEYVAISDWSIDKGVVYVYDHVQSQLELFDSKTGVHQESIKLPYSVVELQMVDQHMYADRLMMKNEWVQNSDRLLTTDLRNPTDITAFYPGDREDVPNNWHQLFSYNKEVYFLSPAFNKLYKVKKDHVVPYIFFDFGAKNMTPEVLSDNQNLSKLYNGNYWFGISNIYENSHYIFGSMLSGSFENRYLLFNKKTRKNLIVKTDAVKNYPYRHVTAPDAVYKEAFYKVHPLWVIRFMKSNTKSKAKILTDEQKTDPAFMKLTEATIGIDDNPWVAVYHIKEKFSFLEN